MHVYSIFQFTNHIYIYIYIKVRDYPIISHIQRKIFHFRTKSRRQMNKGYKVEDRKVK